MGKRDEYFSSCVIFLLLLLGRFCDTCSVVNFRLRLSDDCLLGCRRSVPQGDRPTLLPTKLHDRRGIVLSPSRRQLGRLFPFPSSLCVVNFPRQFCNHNPLITFHRSPYHRQGRFGPDIPSHPLPDLLVSRAFFFLFSISSCPRRGVLLSPAIRISSSSLLDTMPHPRKALNHPLRDLVVKGFYGGNHHYLAILPRVLPGPQVHRDAGGQSRHD